MVVCNVRERDSTATRSRGGAGTRSDVTLALDWESIGRLVRVNADASLMRERAIANGADEAPAMFDGVGGLEMRRE